MTLAVLIVDDSASFRAAASELLCARGLQVIATAATAEQALDVAARQCPDGFLVDIDLSGQDGFAAARALADVCPRSGVVLTSANVTHVPAELLQRCGADAFIVKDALASADLEALFTPAGT